MSSSLKKTTISLIEKILIIYIISPIIFRLNFFQIRDSKYRFLRVYLLRSGVDRLHFLMKNFRFMQDILVKSNGDTFVVSDGVMLDILGSNRYFKVSGNLSGNESTLMHKFLKSRGYTDIKTIVDIGANVGEISLYFSKEYPESRIISLEPSPSNLFYFKKNITAQSFNTKNISIFELAISDMDGQAFLSDSKSQSSIIVPDKHGNGFKVKTMRLATFWKEAGLGDVDFVKIDIEGAEPLLLNDLEEYARRARVWLIEFGSKNKKDAYVPFFYLFEEKGYRIFSRHADKYFENANEAANYFYLQKDGDDFWFVEPESFA